LPLGFVMMNEPETFRLAGRGFRFAENRQAGMITRKRAFRGRHDQHERNSRKRHCDSPVIVAISATNPARKADTFASN